MASERHIAAMKKRFDYAIENGEDIILITENNTQIAMTMIDSEYRGCNACSSIKAVRLLLEAMLHTTQNSMGLSAGVMWAMQKWFQHIKKNMHRRYKTETGDE